MRSLVFACVALLPSVALPSERVRLVDNAPQTSIKDTLETVCRAFDAEDLDLYEGCFVSGKREQIRRRYAMIFVSERCSMQLLESHAISVGEDSAESAARYKICDTQGPREVVSKVRFVKEGGKWLIDKETVVSNKASGESRSMASHAPEPMAVPVRVDQRNEQGWDPMKPDPEKISPHLRHLIGDIGIRPGTGCAGGNCANGRCEVR